MDDSAASSSRQGWDDTEKRRLKGLWEGGAEAEDIARLMPGRSARAVREAAKTFKFRRPAWYLAEVRAAAARARHGSRKA